MTEFDVIRESARLHRKWVSQNGEPNLERIRGLIQRELRHARQGYIQVSATLVSEMKGELVLIGKLKVAQRKLAKL